MLERKFLSLSLSCLRDLELDPEALRLVLFKMASTVSKQAEKLKSRSRSMVVRVMVRNGCAGDGQKWLCWCMGDG